ncbi:peptidase domain-containing ABC transporter [Synechococcus sp. CBW1107]|uniref:peptidase domain-containing ABC transporter n=1 Tax=Synechococcus sp. CBW1107 TaxID=2789857 RepID=UPI002AD4BE87|nr:peptidase domain-containing ABC transporter [Synechococcus sp. CBW1107]CAK6696052.1 Vitamin B12 import ATP-binding protein BtuD [Synechococcus sp. CBW1107]
MTLSPTASLLLHPAFKGLSEAGTKALEEQVVGCMRYRPGQQLADPRILPNQVLVILQGQARLLGKEQGRLTTLEKLGPGATVGLASMLRASPCESVSAASEVVAAALPDGLVLELYRSEPSFRHWCNHTLWPAELYALAIQLGKQIARPDLTLAEMFFQLVEKARLVSPEPGGLLELADDQRLLLASANAEANTLGETLDPSKRLPAARSPFPLRLITVPNGLLAGLKASSAQAAPGSNGVAGNARLQDAPSAPVATARDFGQDNPIRQLRLIRGEGPLEETLASFQMLASLLKLPYRRDAIEKSIREQLRRGLKPNLNTCGYLAANLGLHAMSTKLPAAACSRLHTPALIPWQEGFALVVASNSAGITLASPKEGWVELSPQRIAELYPKGLELLLLDRSVTTPEQRFNLGWFLPALKRHRGVLLQVLVASFVVQLFGLANPLLIQVIIDKVISQRSLDTLQVLGMALVVVTVMEGVLGSLRTFLFVETTNRIDLRLGAEVIDHLLRLPLNYFDKRPVGELGTRIAELEKIRGFLTGQALTTVLDAAFSVIYIVVMAFYSWLLTIVALVVVPIQVSLTVLGAPLFRRQFRQAAQENARTQSHLVEVLTGIQTVKAQNVEMVSRWKWQELYARYIGRSFEQTVTGTALSQTSTMLQKLSQLLVLWVGASLVLDGQLTLGQLIAFRIISGYVTQPLLRLSSIWQNIQELRVSFERLADVVDTPQESNLADQQKIPLPPIEGHVCFEALSFSFQKGQPPVLKEIDLDVPAGTFVGIVGQSGSGKSTLMKLLPRLYSPDLGRVLIDGYDIDKVELYSLRRQIGIVPQDPLLFSGTVNENIALTDPEASSEAIVKAARIACAHDFVMSLPSGYSTPVGERGASLSGGQRQRLAIARTLLSNPKLLVMDEATSALDYDTERRLCDNLRQELKHCTVFFITHRLSTIRNADLIVMMHQGAIVETGTHAQLMEVRGRYFALSRQQEAGS